MRSILARAEAITLIKLEGVVCYQHGYIHIGNIPRVSQEFFQTRATPKLSAFGYVKMELIEKN